MARFCYEESGRPQLGAYEVYAPGASVLGDLGSLKSIAKKVTKEVKKLPGRAVRVAALPTRAITAGGAKLGIKPLAKVDAKLNQGIRWTEAHPVKTLVGAAVGAAAVVAAPVVLPAVGSAAGALGVSSTTLLAAGVSTAAKLAKGGQGAPADLEFVPPTNVTAPQEIIAPGSSTPEVPPSTSKGVETAPAAPSSGGGQNLLLIGGLALLALKFFAAGALAGGVDGIPSRRRSRRRRKNARRR